MGIVLLLDQGVPRDAASCLRDAGYECTHAGDLGMSKAADDEIVSLARDRNAIVVTLDADFHALLAVSGASTPSVIRLRIQGLRGPEVAAAVGRVVEQFGADLNRGAFVSVKAHKITCRRLPIGSGE